MTGAPVEPATEPEQSSTHLEPGLAAALAYLLWFVSGAAIVAVERRSPYVGFHAVQSTLTFLIFILWLLVALLFDVPRLPLVGFSTYLVSVPAALVLWLVLMFKAYQGERFELPVIGPIARRLSDARFLACAAPNQ